MAAFDAYLAVDWSGANTPKTGKDSIWISERGADGTMVPSINPPTRTAAFAHLEARIAHALSTNERVLIGFDFAFGYPAGAATALTGKSGWRALWQALDEAVTDDDANASNRFAIADALNARQGEDGALFWGIAGSESFAHLGPRRDGVRYDTVPEKRLAERSSKGAQPVWKLAYAGSVGSQALLGIPRLNQLRTRFAGKIAIWPFETHFAEDLSAPVVLAEIYPSLLTPDPAVTPKDRAQVETYTAFLARLDAAGQLPELLAAPADLTTAERDSVLAEEGWILGVGNEHLLAEPASPAPYLRDPDAIYRASFAIVREEVDLARFDEAEAKIAIRMIHACGQIEIAPNLVFSRGAVISGVAALAAGHTIFCDAEMVASGIIRSRLASGNDVVCTLNAKGVAEAAKRDQTTRSAAAVDLWDARLEGGIVVIGNAPTALFRLLERIEAGGPKPALIVGLPVGFVGAAESKAALAEAQHEVPFITLPGRMGGSAMASAAVNALAGLKVRP